MDFDGFRRIISKAHQTHCGAGTQVSVPPGRLRKPSFQLFTYQPDPETPENVDRLKSALGSIDPDCDRKTWCNICWGIHLLGWLCSKELAKSWSKGEIK